MQEEREHNRTRTKNKVKTGQLFNFGKDSYLERTSRPIYAIFFLLPFLIFYDLGQYCLDYGVLNQLRIRVAALFWLQHLLESIGFDDKLAWLTPPLMIVVILTAMQITSGKQWRFWIGDILPMTFECTLFAVPLLVLTLFLNIPAGSKDNIDRLDASSIRIQNGLPTNGSPMIENELSIYNIETERNNSSRLQLTHFIIGIGIGIHEEFVFRLVLICVLTILFQDVVRLAHKESIVLSIIISAVLFSIYCNLDFFVGQADTLKLFNFMGFAFRTTVGIYFAVLFAVRGFGITAGTHIYYNIIAILLSLETYIIPLIPG